MTRQKIIIDTDPGIDDAMAIHFAFAHPDIEVIGLTTVFGNVHTKTATRNALTLAEMANYSCPVAPGADRPMVQDQHPPAVLSHGVEGFGNVPATTPSTKVDSRSAADFICDSINRNPGVVTLCAIGPLTNLARALDLDPGIASVVKDVVIMGGVVEGKGNVSNWAEANIWSDPHAAEQVFAADWPMTLVGLDVTLKVQCTPADFRGIAAASPRIGGFLNDATQFSFEDHRQTVGLDGCYMHDPTAVIAITDPNLFTRKEIALSVMCEGERIGQTVVSNAENRGLVAVCVDVDQHRVRDVFLTTLNGADVAMMQRKNA